METALAFLAFCMVANGSPIQRSEPNLKDLAGELLNETTTLLTNLDAVKQNIENAPETVNSTISSFDYGVSKNPQIIELEEQLKLQRFKKNVKSCEDLLDYDKQAMKQIFDFIFWLAVNSELQQDTESVNNLRNVLQTVSTNVQEPKLDETIKLCTDKPEQCKLTTEYQNEVDNAKKNIVELQKLPNSLIDTVVNDDFRKQVSDKVSEEVYPQVSKCINKLKN